jgi:hypothetical protein
LAYGHGVFPLVYNTLKKYGTLISADKLIYMKLSYMDVVKQNMSMSSELIRIIKFFDENNIEAIPFKGPVLSELAYGDVISRQYSDLDILIKKNDLEKAYILLESNDYLLELDNHFLKNKLFLEKNSDVSFYNKQKNITVELHWRLFKSQFSKEIDKIDIFKNKDHFLLNNNKISIFQNELLLVYLCMHGSKHNWERIEWILDIDKLLRNLEKIDFNLVFEISKKLHCLKMLNLGLVLSNIIYDSPILSDTFNKSKKEYFNKNIEFIFKEFININNDKTEFKKNLTIFKFHYSLNDNLVEKIFFLKRTFLDLSNNDTLFMNLDNRFIFLHYLLKPFRLLFKYIFK